MKLKHTVIVDNFLERPSAVREVALGLEYKASPCGIYSGKRTLSLKYTHKFLYDRISRRILSYYNLNTDDYSAEMCFHITEGKFGQQGWVHSDYPVVLAGVLYLNPGINDISSGTSLFDCKPGFKSHDSKSIDTLRNSFIEGQDYVAEKEQYNSNYNKTVIIGGKFNRLVIYPGDMLHAGEGYFGEDINNSRLTLLTFFVKKNNI